jgi:TatD DNase family protein
LVRVAAELDLPIIVHCRDAYEDAFRIIEENRDDNTRGVFHCFSGGVKELKRVLEMGFYVSYTGNITYKNSRLLPTVHATPIDRVLLETDCPFLTPHPHRGKRNEPAYIPLIAAGLAEIKGLSKEDIARITNYNAYRLFSIGKAPEKEIVYKIRNSLYVELTTRCTNKCIFCPRLTHPVVKGHNIQMKREEEPNPNQILNAIEDPSSYDEVVFCGFGEPTLRLDIMLETARRLKSKGTRRLRLDTNGQGNLIHRRDIVPDLAELFDAVSISLNESNAERYQKLCRSNFGEDAFPAILDFARRCVAKIPDVTLTAVGYPDVDTEACRAVADEIGAKLRVREYNEVG